MMELMSTTSLPVVSAPTGRATDFSEGTPAGRHQPTAMDIHNNIEMDAKQVEVDTAQPTETKNGQGAEKEDGGPVMESLSSSAGGDLDSTGDSDRLVIAEDQDLHDKEVEMMETEVSTEEASQSEQSEPQHVKQSQSEDSVLNEMKPSQAEVGSEDKNVNQSEVSTDQTPDNVQGLPLEMSSAESEIETDAKSLHEEKESEKSLSADETAANSTPALSETEAKESQIESHCEQSQSVGDGELRPAEESIRAGQSDSQDLDTQSNASTDGGSREASAPPSSINTDTTEKKRRRRKPIKVSKHDASLQQESPIKPEMGPGEKFDKNYNSVEVEPEAKPVSRLMNSFVAKAMKLWYDEELPKTLQGSPSKEINKYITETKPEDPTKLNMPKEKDSESKEAQPEREVAEKGRQDREKQDTGKDYRSGVAPDDQYYSTPSPATPDSRFIRAGVQEFWTPEGRCYNTSVLNHSGDVDGPQLPISSLPSDASPAGAPLVAKAMQSLRAPSPAVSPSLASDQESPSAGPKLYFCSLCNKSFTFRTNLTRHQRTFHGRPCRRRTRDVLTGKDNSDQCSVSSEDTDHPCEKRELLDERPVIMPKTEPHMDPHYGRFSPSVVSDAKAGRFSPSMPSPSASSCSSVSDPPKTVLPPYMGGSMRHSEQDYIITTPKEKVSCSLCLTSFDSTSELSRHEPTCRGMDRSQIYSDASGAIDLSKPKAVKSEKVSSREGMESSAHMTYKPKFHYTMADILNTGITQALESPLTNPFIPHPAALHSMGLLPPHLSPAALLPPHLAGLPYPMPTPTPTPDPTSTKNPYKCSFCTKKYSSYKSLAKHVGFVHKINLMGLHQQPDTDNMAAMVALARAEMKMLVEQESSGAPLNLTGEGSHFPCKICGQTFFDVANLRTHYHNIHLGAKDGAGRESQSPDLGRCGSKSTEWVCDICGQNFASKRNLNRHLNHVHKVDRRKEQQPAVRDAVSKLVDTTTVRPYPPTGPGQTVIDLAPPAEDAKTRAVHHLQDVVDRVVSADDSLKAKPEDKPLSPTSAPPQREHPVKLPPKKAIMEEYQKEAEMKLRLEREQHERLLLEQQRASPASSVDSGVLNLSQIEKTIPEEVGAKSKESVMDLSAPKDRASPFEVGPKMYPSVDYANEGKGKQGEVGDRKEYYPNPFSAILNLSQTYLRKLLNDTPMPSPPPPPPNHPDLYSTGTMKDKENNTDRYGRSVGYNRSNSYSPDTTTRLRDMLSSKGLNVGNGYQSGDDSRSSSRNNSRPPSGRSTPVEGFGHYDQGRRPLVMSSENQPDGNGYIASGLSEVSPLRMNTTNMMALKQKLVDQNTLITPEWKPKLQKKRKNSDFSVEDLTSSKEKLMTDLHEPLAKKSKDDIKAMRFEGDQAKPTSVDNVRTGEFPAIAIGKRHICGLCGASFTFQTNLTRHQRKLHGKPFVRKSSVNQGMKVDGPARGEETLPLSMVPMSSSTPPLTLIKQE